MSTCTGIQLERCTYFLFMSDSVIFPNLFVLFSVIFVIKSVDFYTNAIYLYLSDSKRRRKSFLSMLHSASEQERMYQEANDFS